MSTRARVYHQRAIIGAAITLEYEHRDQHGDRVIAGTTPTVACTRRSDGSVVTVGAVVEPGATEAPVYTAVIAATENTLVDELVAVWTTDGTGHDRIVSVVARPYFTLEQVEAAGYETYSEPDRARMRAARIIAERECERIVGRTFVPTYRRLRVNVDPWTGPELQLPDTYAYELDAVLEYDTDGSTVAHTWTAAELAAVYLDGDTGSITRLSSSWVAGLTDVGYRFGLDEPPTDIAEAVMRRYRYHLAHPASAIPDRAIGFSAAEGGTFRLSTPGPMRTGDPDVDAIYLSPDYHIPAMAR